MLDKLLESKLRLQSLFRLKITKYRTRHSQKRGETELPYAPSSLNLLMIDRCNAGCIMCGHDYKSCGSSDALTLKKIKTIYSKLVMEQLVEVVYGGGGEPFLNPELAEIAAYTREKCPAVQHTVISNMVGGYNQSMVKKLVENRVHFLVSVNAASKKIFHEIAGVDAFEHVCENIKKIVLLRRELKSSIGISISIILMKKNISELPEFVRLAKELGVDSVKAVYVRIYPEQYRKKADGTIQIAPLDSLYFHQDESNRSIREAEKVAREIGVCLEHQPLFNCSKIKERDCLEPWRSLYIGFNGELYPCAASEIMFMNKVQSGKYNSGNILKQSLEEIWNNSFWQALRKTNAGSMKEELIPECLCCGSSIDWWGVNAEKAHVMDWSEAENSDFSI
ncbi:MAG: hypothetical protein VR65_08040 [Desulfobulbaceae bacterium BRH_c16a]|nr:MAG: hypothetical protein VR65_08040 [Desulfobulbaceae bacterium BRH_c16a]